MADEFATAVTFLEVKDQKYKSQLKANEAITQASAGKMQASLSGISIDAGKATAGVSALGGAAAVTGNAAVGAAAQIGTLVVSLGPLGPIAIALGVIVGALTIAWKLFTSAQEKAAEKLQITTDRIKEQEQSLGPLRSRLLVLQGVSLDEQLKRQIAILAKEERALGADKLERRQELAHEIQILVERRKLLLNIGEIEATTAANKRQADLLANEAAGKRKLESVERARREDESLAREQFVAALQDRLFAQRDANERKRLADLAVSARSVLNEKLSVLQSALSAVAAGPRGVIGALTAGAFRGQTNIAAPDLRTGKTEDVQRDKRRNSILESIEKVLQQIKTQATGGLAQ